MMVNSIIGDLFIEVPENISKGYSKARLNERLKTQENQTLLNEISRLEARRGNKRNKPQTNRLLFSVGNPRDQMTKRTEFVCIFSSESGGIFENISIYTCWNLFK